MTPTLTDETARLIRAEALLAERVPTMRTKDRMALLLELRAVLDAAPEPEKAKCLKCHGRGERIHGWAMCPGPCKDCDGTGEVMLEVRT